MIDPVLARGEEILLDLQDSARRRVTCGLSWGGATEDGLVISRAAVAEGSKTGVHDLDLVCLLFDKFGGFIDGITGEENFRTGDNGNIYHTGDVTGSEDVIDEEEILLELFNLSRKIYQVFFIAEVQSFHNFGEVSGPTMRLSTATGDKVLATADLTEEAAQTANAFIFGCLRREQAGWVFKYIGDYFDGSEVTDWAHTLKEYLEIATPDGKGTYTGPRIPAKNQTVPLHYSKEARQRVFCGLNWDPSTEVTSAIDKLKNRGHNVETFDLDLACVMYDKKHEAVDGVSAKADETVDGSGKVYHSGDHTSGDGDSVDDETISVELKGLPEDIHHLIFLAEIQSKHLFKDVSNPSMRIADGKTDENQLTSSLTAAEGNLKNAYIFARISRKGEGWTLTYIDKYVDGTKINDWIEHLKRYLG